MLVSIMLGYNEKFVRNFYFQIGRGHIAVQLAKEKLDLLIVQYRKQLGVRNLEFMCVSGKTHMIEVILPIEHVFLTYLDKFQVSLTLLCLCLVHLHLHVFVMEIGSFLHPMPHVHVESYDLFPVAFCLSVFHFVIWN